MRSLGCTYGQGYFFSHPLSDTDLVAAFAAEQLAASPSPAEASSTANPGRFNPQPRLARGNPAA
jgi:hypothetical protein